MHIFQTILIYSLPLHVSIMYWPPYSPFFNLVEQAISAFKAELKKALEEIRPQLLDEDRDHRMAHLAQLSEQLQLIAPEHDGICSCVRAYKFLANGEHSHERITPSFPISMTVSASRPYLHPRPYQTLSPSSLSPYLPYLHNIC